MADEFSNSNQGSSEDERAARLSRQQQAGRLARGLSKPVAESGSRLAGKAVGKGTEYGTRGAAAGVGAAAGAATGALAAGVGAIPGALQGARTGWTSSAPAAKILGTGAERASRWAARRGIEKAAQKAGEAGGGAAARVLPSSGKSSDGQDAADKIPGLLARLAAKPFLAMLSPFILLLVIVGGFFALLVLVVLLITPFLGPTGFLSNALG